MKCLIPGINVKVLARAIHALAKIGDELYVEPLPEGMCFRTVNVSRSAYASFTFDPSFFLNYVDGGSAVTRDEEDEDSVKCKIAMKSCIAVFKSPNTIDKHVETCQLKLEPDDNKLILQFRCRHGIIKNHYLPIIECETLQAVYTKDMAPNVLIAEPKLLIEALHNFQSNHEELTLEVMPSKITLRNFTDFAPDPHKVIRTELCLESGEFVQYSVKVESPITFCLKEFRALLSFAESVTLPIAINFDTAGRPVVFVVSHPHTFEANFVLATLMPQNDSQQASKNSNILSKKRASSSSISSMDNIKRTKDIFPQKDVDEPIPCCSKDGDFGISSRSKSITKDLEKNHNNNGCLENLDEVFDMEWDHVNNELENQNEVVEVKKGKIEMHKKSYQEQTQDQIDMSSIDSGSRGLMDYSEQRESDISSLWRTPFSGTNMVYRRCFQETFNPEKLPGYNEILAPDSDEESD